MESKGLIMVVLAVMVGAILMGTIVNQTKLCKTTHATTGEWHNATANTTLVTTTNYPVLAGTETITAYNLTGTLIGELTRGENYTVTNGRLGQFQMVTYGPDYGVANLSFAYTDTPDCYVTDSGARASITLVTLLYILGLAVFAGKGMGVF